MGDRGGNGAPRHTTISEGHHVTRWCAVLKMWREISGNEADGIIQELVGTLGLPFETERAFVRLTNLAALGNVTAFEAAWNAFGAMN